MKKIIPVLLLLGAVLILGYRRQKLIDAAIAQATRPEVDYEQMEIYQSLRSAVTEESTLEQMLDAFAEMSRIPVDSSSNMFLYEVYPSSFQDEEHLICHIVRQVDDPGTDEYIQLHLEIIYILEEDMAGFRETTWYDNDPDGFLQHIRSGDAYKILSGKPIHQRYVSIDSTW